MSLVENIRQLQPGQKLWFVPKHYKNQAGEVEIAKIGREYAHLTTGRLKPYRITAKGVVLDGEDAVGSVYLSRETYEAGIAISEAWRVLFRHVGRAMPNSVTIENIREAAKLLGFEGEL